MRTFAHASRQSYCPTLERLEDRNVPAITLRSDGLLQFVGTQQDDTVHVKLSPSGTFTEVLLTNSAGLWEQRFFYTNQISRLLILTYGGNDSITNDTGIPSLIYAGAGNDTVLGGWGDDEIYGEDGHDDLYGWYGNDKLYGGAGWDYLFGEAGNDFLDGGYKDGYVDRLEGGTDSDTFVKAYGNEIADCVVDFVLFQDVYRWTL